MEKEYTESIYTIHLFCIYNEGYLKYNDLFLCAYVKWDCILLLWLNTPGYTRCAASVITLTQLFGKPMNGMFDI